MSTTTIAYEKRADVATLTLTPPEGKAVTLETEVLVELESVIEQVQRDAPRVLLMRSASERFYCVGANIKVLKETDENSIVPWVMLGHRVLNRLEDLPLPVVAVVEGYAMGGGLELAMACDLIFASDSARFAQSEAALGFIPGWGGTYRLARRVGSAKAKQMFYRAQMVTAGHAEKIGLVDFCGNQAQLNTELDDFCQKVSQNNINAISQFKTILNEQERAQRHENAAVEALRSITCLEDPDARRRLQDFLKSKGK